jgi:hypothetical protein
MLARAVDVWGPATVYPRDPGTTEWMYQWEPQGTMVAFDAQGIITDVSAYRSEYATVEGINPGGGSALGGSTRREIQKAFGPPDAITPRDETFATAGGPLPGLVRIGFT